MPCGRRNFFQEHHFSLEREKRKCKFYVKSPELGQGKISRKKMKSALSKFGWHMDQPHKKHRKIDFEKILQPNQGNKATGPYL